MCLLTKALILRILLAFIYLNECNNKKRRFSTRTIGGKDVSFKSFPFIAPIITKPSIRYNGAFSRETLVCGSSIITNYWAISSRTCYDDIKQSEIADTDLLLKSGTDHWNGTKATESNLKLHDVESLHTENYVGYLMLIKVVQPFLRQGIVKVPIAGKSYNYKRVKILELAGYGATETVGPKNTNLKSFQGTRVQERYCEYSNLGEYTLCVGPSQHQKHITDVCLGDTGGPIVHSVHGKILVGIPLGVIDQEVCEPFQIRNKPHIKIGLLEPQLKAFSKTVTNFTGVRYV